MADGQAEPGYGSAADDRGVRAQAHLLGLRQVVGEGGKAAVDDQVQVLAQSTGSPLHLVPEDVAEDVAARTAAQSLTGSGPDELFAAVRRQLDRESPGYVD